MSDFLFYFIVVVFCLFSLFIPLVFVLDGWHQSSALLLFFQLHTDRDILFVLLNLTLYNIYYFSKIRHLQNRHDPCTTEAVKQQLISNKETYLIETKRR